MLQWFDQFAEFTEFSESLTSFRKNSIGYFKIRRADMLIVSQNN